MLQGQRTVTLLFVLALPNALQAFGDTQHLGHVTEGRLVVTLAWLTPINPDHRNLREAKLTLESARIPQSECSSCNLRGLSGGSTRRPCS
ncbi:MAG TPA: hypothetical protein PKD55_12050 [Bellilinea sp.]|nr:hypothetical protein [Bellilinea sp.]